MKRFKLVILMCCCVLVSILAVACGNTETITSTETTDSIATSATTSVATATTNLPPTTEEVPTKFIDLKIGGTSISEYTIVYAKSPYKAYTRSPDKKQYFPVYDFDHETANRLSDLIFDVTGIRLNVVEDVDATEMANEILIGKTKRSVLGDVDAAKLGSDEYVLEVVETKLVICGGEFGTTWHAIDYLETLFAAALSEKKVEYSFSNDYLWKGNYHLTVIGCIGDSITQGIGASDQSLYSYPAQMGRLLWKDAIVLNFGSSGATMRNDLGDAYTKRGVYSNAVKAASEVDIFTVMLGTNDSNRDPSWSNSDTREFKNSCLGIMKALQRQNRDLEFVLVNCPTYFGTGTFGSAEVRQVQAELVTSLNDSGCPTTLFDMYTATQNMSAHFPGGLHPNDMGYLKIAYAFAEFLQNFITPAISEAK